MLTEAEFYHKFKICLRRGRKKLRPLKMADKMHMSPGVYYAYERGDLNLTIYQLYQFMHATGKYADFIKQIFDDEWMPPSMYKLRIPNNK